MDRNAFAAGVIQCLPGVDSVLDVGCREGHIADHISPAIQYFGADLSETSPRVKYVGDFSKIDFGRKFSAVIALDILEHTEKVSENFDKLVSLADKHVIVSLPNCADLTTRIRFLRNGRMGGKYLFDGSDPLDRHRWVMNYDEIMHFFTQKASRWDFSLQVVRMKYGASGRQDFDAMAGRLLSAVLPDALTTRTVGAIFSKRPG